MIAVGASDSKGTLTQVDDKVPAFSPWPKRGATRSVDLIAPGTHIQGLRVPESYLDQNHPEGQLGSRYFRGSGTSESAAIVSGAAALILDKHPGATPDEVKKLLTSTGYDIVGKAQAIGGGELQLATTLVTPVPNSTQTWPSVGRFGQARAVARHRPPHARWRRTDRRAGHLRSALRLGRDGGARGEREQLVGGQVERELWSGSSWSGNSWSAGPATPGPAAAGPAIAGPAVPGPATRGPATAGAATPGRATAGRRPAGTSRPTVASGGHAVVLHSGHDSRAVPRSCRPLRIGITGPIGCGKSTVAGWLGERPGVVVIDADVVAREVLEPGEPALDGS